MDEATRRLERAAAEGDPQALLKLARIHLHAGQRGEALRVTDAASEPEVLVFRAELLLDEDLCAAADAAGRACRLRGDALPAELSDALSARLSDQLRSASPARDDDPLWALHVAGLLAGIGRLGRSETLSELVARWPELEPLVEALRARSPKAPRESTNALARAVARGAVGAELYRDEPVPTRLFSAHGPDFKSGTFISFDTSCEDRLTYFGAPLFRAIDRLLPPADAGYERSLAFGRGYGLAVERGAATGLLEEGVRRVNELGLLPFSLTVHHHQPYDVLLGVEGEGALSPEDQRLARRFAVDLSRHPARMGNPEDTAPYARLLGSYRRGNPEPAALDALLDACQRTYSAVGYAALERFAREAHSENERMAARRAARSS